VTATATGLRSLLDWYAPTGRIRRSDWWLRYVLPFVLIGAAARWLDALVFPASVTDRFSHDDPDLLWFLPDRGGPVLGAVALVLLVPYVAAMVTRLHDRDHSAWWLLWFLLGPIGILVLVVTVGFLDTQRHPNRYGPPPC
jgi:uncharacterized membrane protein YhaH (DUF805 family)